jgi:hypothetical protein
MVSVRSTKILIVWREGEEGSASELKANTCLHVASTLELVLKRNTKCIPLLAQAARIKLQVALRALQLYFLVEIESIKIVTCKKKTDIGGNHII